MNDQRLGNDIFHPESRIERGKRILKNDLHVAAQAPHLATASRQQIASLEAHAARSRLNQPKNQTPQRALARTGLSHETKRLAGLNVERNIIDRAHFSPRLPAKYCLAMRKDLRQVANFNQRHKLSCCYFNKSFHILEYEMILPRRQQRHRGQRRQQSNEFPPAEVFF